MASKASKEGMNPRAAHKAKVFEGKVGFGRQERYFVRGVEVGTTFSTGDKADQYGSFRQCTYSVAAACGYDMDWIPVEGRHDRIWLVAERGKEGGRISMTPEKARAVAQHINMVCAMAQLAPKLKKESRSK